MSLSSLNTQYLSLYLQIGIPRLQPFAPNFAAYPGCGKGPSDPDPKLL